VPDEDYLVETVMLGPLGINAAAQPDGEGIQCPPGNRSPQNGRAQLLRS
jgi:hypothetical protein